MAFHRGLRLLAQRGGLFMFSVLQIEIHEVKPPWFCSKAAYLR